MASLMSLYQQGHSLQQERKTVKNQDRVLPSARLCADEILREPAILREDYWEGDWRCHKCGDHQFARNRECRQDGEAQPELLYGERPTGTAEPSASPSIPRRDEVRSLLELGLLVGASQSDGLAGLGSVSSIDSSHVPDHNQRQGLHRADKIMTTPTPANF